MAKFPEALDAALHGWFSPPATYRSPVTSARGLKARMGALERQHGSKKAAAAAAGISPSTWGKWGSGKAKPTTVSLYKLERAYLAGLRGRSTSLSRPTKMHVQAEVACTAPRGHRAAARATGAYYNLEPHRWFRADRGNLDLGPMTKAWLDGHPPEVVAELALNAVESAYGNRFEFEGSDVTVELL